MLILAGGAIASSPRWKEWPGYSDQVALVDASGQQVGLYSYKDRKFWPRKDGKWGDPCDPPIAIPPQPLAANYGVDTDKMDGKRKYYRQGNEVTREQAYGAFDLPNDSGKLRVTVIGDGREQVVKDLGDHPALAVYKGQYLLQAYAPDHWAVKDAGFVTSGKPTIYIQKPDGKVLHRQDTYSAESLADALRKVQPNYQPAKDPNVNNPLQPLSGITDRIKDIPLPVLALGGLGLFFLLKRGE